MNLQSNYLTKANSQKRKDINYASVLVNKNITQMQSILDLPNYVLIQNKGESPPGCSSSLGISLRLYPDINRTTCKGNRINNQKNLNTKIIF